MTIRRSFFFTNFVNTLENLRLMGENEKFGNNIFNKKKESYGRAKS